MDPMDMIIDKADGRATAGGEGQRLFRASPADNDERRRPGWPARARPGWADTLVRR